MKIASLKSIISFKIPKYLVLFGSLLFVVRLAKAQIVNIEKERIKNQDSIKIMGKLSGTFNIVQNKNVSVYADFNPHIQYKNRKHLLLAIAQLEYSAINNSTINSGGLIHLRYNYAILKNLKAEIFTQAQYNKIWNMPLRYLVGFGPRFKLWEQNQNRLYFGPLYMFELQKVQNNQYVQYNHRLSAYLSWNLISNKILFFSGTLYYQPLLAHFQNYRISGLCELNFVISPHFTIDNRLILSYDQTNTTDVPAKTYRFTSGLGYKF